MADMDHFNDINFHQTSTWAVIYLAYANRFHGRLELWKALQFLGKVFLANEDELTAESLFTVALDGFTFMDAKDVSQSESRLTDLKSHHKEKLAHFARINVPIMSLGEQLTAPEPTVTNSTNFLWAWRGVGQNDGILDLQPEYDFFTGIAGAPMCDTTNVWPSSFRVLPPGTAPLSVASVEEWSSALNPTVSRFYFGALRTRQQKPSRNIKMGVTPVCACFSSEFIEDKWEPYKGKIKLLSKEPYYTVIVFGYFFFMISASFTTSSILLSGRHLGSGWGPSDAGYLFMRLESAVETLPDAPGMTVFRSELTEKKAGQERTLGKAVDPIKGLEGEVD
ncbi:hypothetical protein B0H11DRAFT_1908115 [Mycena galericulata]|nr:hypothetical protein B0H11DRAFT_1908115 [Mycena galericulata]